jgi:hypothetical protein
MLMVKVFMTETPALLWRVKKATAFYTIKVYRILLWFGYRLGYTPNVHNWRCDPQGSATGRWWNLQEVVPMLLVNGGMPLKGKGTEGPGSLSLLWFMLWPFHSYTHYHHNVSSSSPELSEVSYLWTNKSTSSVKLFFIN